jgi:hypothetical protein
MSTSTRLMYLSVYDNRVTFTPKVHYQTFWGVLIDLVVDLVDLIIKTFDDETER